MQRLAGLQGRSRFTGCHCSGIKALQPYSVPLRTSTFNRHWALPPAAAYTPRNSSGSSSNSSRSNHQRHAARQQQLTAAAVPAGSSAVTQQQQQLQGKDVVIAFYDAYNKRDLAAISNLIADDISYHDLVYDEPHEGREGVMSWLKKIRRYAPDDLKFVIEDITDGDATKVGVKWHVECGDGVFFPFSRGCSFITLNSSCQIQTVRDVVEPSTKPGDSTLVLLGALTPLIRKLGPAADPANLKRLPIAAAAVWALYVGYLSIVMLSTAVPGAPAIATPPEVFEEILQESINLWWINDSLTALGLSFIPNVPCPPVSEAVFNFVLGWCLMFLPVMLTDGPSQKVEKKGAWFTAIMFITNVFFIPFMALRAMPEPLEPAAAATSSSSSSVAAAQRQRKVAVPGSQRLPSWSPALGAFGGFIGVFAIYWALAGRPEFGDLSARYDYFQTTFNSNRVFWAFMLDMGLFYIWQLSFLQAAPAQYKYVPYFGLAGWLIAGGTAADAEEA
ncbi:hypothetical protein OEZ86_009610 [Tetradesmus obliquus]|uniref:SnoaL-like domain-containing protein n=1 Tax=Tetradesmus obliquus TaxID=3088 RepID=A0ABY8UMD7_TETOB|nr:hypothetical protein OEZ85_001054 [Tetradesmus obliquus]WIA43085.1 hypothetical protein OEZ86_009610 [Tetradesmus obliquus]